MTTNKVGGGGPIQGFDETRPTNNRASTFCNKSTIDRYLLRSMLRKQTHSRDVEGRTLLSTFDGDLRLAGLSISVPALLLC